MLAVISILLSKIFTIEASVTGYVVSSAFDSPLCTALSAISAEIFLLGVCYYDLETSTSLIGFFEQYTPTGFAISGNFFMSPNCSGLVDHYTTYNLSTTCDFLTNNTNFQDDYYGYDDTIASTYQQWNYSTSPPTFSIDGIVQP